MQAIDGLYSFRKKERDKRSWLLLFNRTAGGITHVPIAFSLPSPSSVHPSIPPLSRSRVVTVLLLLYLMRLLYWRIFYALCTVQKQITTHRWYKWLVSLPHSFPIPVSNLFFSPLQQQQQQQPRRRSFGRFSRTNCLLSSCLYDGRYIFNVQKTNNSNSSSS